MTATYIKIKLKPEATILNCKYFIEELKTLLNRSTVVDDVAMTVSHDKLHLESIDTHFNKEKNHVKK